MLLDAKKMLSVGFHWVSLHRSQTPIWWGGASCPHPKNPTPRLGPLGLVPRASRSFGPRSSVLRSILTINYLLPPLETMHLNLNLNADVFWL